MASGTALIYDSEMTGYKLLWVDPACKIEVPERLTVSYEALQSKGLVQRCIPVSTREATDEDILLVHSEEYLEAVKQTPYMSLEDLMTFTQQYGDVYFHPNIYHCAKLAVGATLQLVDSVMTGKVRNGMALVRPPGHHSQRSAANGFCVFNNVAIAALYAKKRFNVNRILIVDWDIHHGQGVQYCFEEDPSVLYFSWHRYEHQSFWPNLRESDYDTVGKGKGAGFNINLPWNKVGMNNSDYLSAFFHVLLPVAYEFGPELVLVSAGFDSAIGDPEGHMCASPEVFAHLTHLLMSLANGRLCAVLEGGYNLTSLAQSVCQTVHTLLGDPAPLLTEVSSPCESALESIQNVRAVHQQYWSCFRHSNVSPVSEPSTKRCCLEESDEGPQEVKKEKENVEENMENIVWPEPLPRPNPTLHTIIALPVGLEVPLPDDCHQLADVPQEIIDTAQRLRDKHFKEINDEKILESFKNIISLLEGIKDKKVRNGLAVVPSVASALSCAVQHALTSLTNRVLVVFIGDGDVPVDTADEQVLLIQICHKEQQEPKSKFHVPVCLKEWPGDTAGFLQVIFGILLPLGYQFSPGLVLEVFGETSGVDKASLAQLTSLLQGLAQGQTLALMQEYEDGIIKATVSSLLGSPAPSLGPLGAPLPVNVQAIEKQRERLLQPWGILQTSHEQLSSPK
ncbi:polyamine deacetylase HDAC10 [Chanos chanos]|uniref:Polyamine deacetylase HDAC10 n=1 Tax=Chanos chanos TaxID=29144 RepID=A0A6J2VEW3_CHACN|nr:polyamine deacetylase HDAC10 [Chanos chanos]